MADTPAPVAPAQYLGFHVATDEYALPILRVREILRYEPPTRVPGVPAFIVGVMNVRGAVLPVIDLAQKLGLPARPVTRWSCVLGVEVTIHGEPLKLGLLVDQVSQVIELRPDEIEPTPSFGLPVRLEFLQGMGRLERRFVLLLELDKVLSAEELRVASLVPSTAAGSA